MSRSIVYFHATRLSYNIYQCSSTLSIRVSVSTQNSYHGSFLFKNVENTYPKGRALVQMYRVVSQTKKELGWLNLPMSYISRHDHNL